MTRAVRRHRLWRVSYSGENRPVLWENLAAESNNSSSVALAKADQTISNQTIKQFFIWDCTEPVATRPLAWQCANSSAYYVHDGNKNVSEVVAPDGSIAAHYDYAPFGAVIAQRGESAAANPWRFSSEFADDELGCDYYNYREYEPVSGRWLATDCVEDGANSYVFVCNVPSVSVDVNGQKKRSMTYVSDSPGFDLAEFLTDMLFINEDTSTPADFQPNQLLGECDCAERLTIMMHGNSTLSGELVIVQWGDVVLKESSSNQEISDMFKDIRFCKECILELRSCNVGRSLYLKNRLVEKTGCQIILYDREVGPFGIGGDEEDWDVLH